MSEKERPIGRKGRKKEKVIRHAHVPYTTSELEKFKKKLREAVDSMIRMEAEKEHRKAVVEAILEEFPVQKKFLNQLIKIEYKATQAEAWDAATSMADSLAHLHPEVNRDWNTESEPETV